MISFALQNFVLSADAIPSTAKAVYMQLMARADEYRKCFPSVDTLAYYVGRSPRTVQRALKVLCEQGLIKKESRYRLNNSQTSNLYTLVEHKEIADTQQKEPPKSYVSKTAFTESQRASNEGCSFSDVIIEAQGEVPVAPIVEETVSEEKVQKENDTCVAPHMPSESAYPSTPINTTKVSQDSVTCQEQPVKKSYIMRKATIAMLFARYFIFTGIPYKEVYRMMTSPDLQASVFSSKTLSNTAKLVFIYLYAKTDENWQCVVNPTKLAQCFARSKRTIQRALAELYEKNMISTQDRYNLTGNRTSCIYTIRKID